MHHETTVRMTLEFDVLTQSHPDDIQYARLSEIVQYHAAKFLQSKNVTDALDWKIREIAAIDDCKVS